MLPAHGDALELIPVPAVDGALQVWTLLPAIRRMANGRGMPQIIALRPRRAP